MLHSSPRAAAVLMTPSMIAVPRVPVKGWKVVLALPVGSVHYYVVYREALIIRSTDGQIHKITLLN